MGYVPAYLAGVDTQVFGEIRGKRLPFIPANYQKTISRRDSL
jgi:hypothetical protein